MSAESAISTDVVVVAVRIEVTLQPSPTQPRGWDACTTLATTQHAPPTTALDPARTVSRTFMCTPPHVSQVVFYQTEAFGWSSMRDHPIGE
jgi:hypothetical protein